MPSVLHLRSSAAFYGAERVLVTLLTSLPDQGVSCRLAVVRNHLTGNQELVDQARAAGIDVMELPCAGRLDVRTYAALRAAVMNAPVDLIHTHDYKSHFYGLAVARACRLPVVATCHGWISSTASLRFYQRLERLLFWWFDRVAVVSPAMAGRFAGSRLRHRTRVIGNGIDTEVFAPDKPGAGRARWGLLERDFVFGTVARLSAEKGHAILLEAFAPLTRRYPQARLLLVGGGPERETLQARTRNLGIEANVVFAGAQARVDTILPDIDCYVSPSLTEGMPMVLLEAMAAALPIVATNVGAVGEMLSEGAGLLVPAADEKALSAAMMAMIRGEVDRRMLGARARERVVALYSADRQAKMYADLYAEVCRGPCAVAGVA